MPLAVSRVPIWQVPLLDAIPAIETSGFYIGECAQSLSLSVTPAIELSGLDAVGCIQSPSLTGPSLAVAPARLISIKQKLEYLLDW